MGEKNLYTTRIEKEFPSKLKQVHHGRYTLYRDPLLISLALLLIISKPSQVFIDLNDAFLQPSLLAMAVLQVPEVHNLQRSSIKQNHISLFTT